MTVPCLDCRALTPQGPRCPACARRRNQARDARSPYRNPAWQRLRAHIARQAGACSVCGSTHRLTVHHLHGRKPDITQGPFEVLCASCHSRYEAEKRAGQRSGLTDTIDRLATTTPTRRFFEDRVDGSRGGRS